MAGSTATAGLYIATQQASVTAISLTGSGCETAEVASSVATGGPSPEGLIAVRHMQGFVPYAKDYTVTSRTEGSCMVALTLNDGSTARRDYTVRHEAGCCSGYYFGPDPIWSP